MFSNSLPALTRRKLLLGVGAAAMAKALWPYGAKAGDRAPQPFVLRPAPGEVRFGQASDPSTGVWCFNRTVPGPAIRIRQGDPVRLIVENHLAEDTTVHWHGIRLPNSMDGVPGLTQSPIRPGESFVYEFTPPDAGTFWYHSHTDGLQQLGRGLAGVLIVDEGEPVAVDRDILWMLQDWRLTPEKQIAPGFGGTMDAVMSGRVGNLVTLNGAVPADEPVRAGERLRLRLVNGALARIMSLRFEGHRPIVVATDGQPCEPFEPEAGRLLLGPAMRIDIILDMQGEPGQHYAVVDDYYDGLSYNLTSLAYATDPPVRAHPRDARAALPRNPLPEPDIANADRFDLHLQGGMAGGGALSGLGGLNGVMTPGMDGGAVWAINGMSMTGDGQAGMPPLFTLKRGHTVVLTMHNDTAWWHPMHIHGYSFRILTRNGSPVPHHQWQDTVLLAPRDVVDCAFVADNSGDWMLHCHVADHQMAGLMTVLRVA
jgi:FtsP/CotA-like multicopper oxidase with cupredoxin domain